MRSMDEEMAHLKDGSTALEQMSVDALLTRWPQATTLFLRYRMACVGCSFSAFDTLAEALHIYAIPRHVFLNELQQLIASSLE